MIYNPYKQRATLGIDGNCAFALLGENLQEGDSEWVDLPDNPSRADKVRCAYEALHKLQQTLNKPGLQYDLDRSHPSYDDGP